MYILIKKSDYYIGNLLPLLRLKIIVLNYFFVSTYLDTRIDFTTSMKKDEKPNSFNQGKINNFMNHEIKE